MNQLYVALEGMKSWVSGCRFGLALARETEKWKNRLRKEAEVMDPGIDGILVTVGLCIIALLLCVVMKDSLSTFIQTIVSSMQTKATGILTGPTP
ncbi:MAG: hypothetical protein IKO03_06750 [Lachnospiraceae bacterium]|jgi:hypothetical protein|nr:hypothetical protein [Lachnospiraceae bacterium]MBR3508447.1 hypothetical protein [Lachnospiraceae bacterium]MBR4606268.1 hypothetical protein [Lachnospiraceae bacterium]